MAEKNRVLSTMLALMGDKNVITLHVAVVDFCEGDIESALFLEQLLYWTPRSSNGWVSKSAKQWYDETRITKYAIDKALRIFSSGMTKVVKKEEVLITGKYPCIETKLKKWDGAPTVHYRLDQAKLAEFWSDWIDSANGFDENSKSDLAKTANPFDENSNSLTETTTDIKKAADAVFPEPLPQEPDLPLPEKDLTFNEKDTAANDKKMKALIAMYAKQSDGWRGRELLPPRYVPYADWWVSKTNLEMYGAKSKPKTNPAWLKAFKEWYEYEIEIDVLEEAYEASKWRMITSPVQITDAAKAIQALRKPADDTPLVNGFSSIGV